MTLGIIIAYLCLLLVLGVISGRFLRRTAGDFFLASRGIGPFMLLMSIFGTTMTAFALIGSTGKAFEKGIGVYGLMASWSGIIHALVFFLVGAKIWAQGKKHGYVTQLSYFRDRYRSDALALVLFPVVVTFVVIYILMGVIGAGKYLNKITIETWKMEGERTAVAVEIDPAALEVPPPLTGRLTYDEATKELVVQGSIHPKYQGLILRANPQLAANSAFRGSLTQLFKKAPQGNLPYSAGMAIVCLVVLFYVFFGGMRATAWANTFQTLVFMVMGILAFVVITKNLGGPEAATQALLEHEEGAKRMAREGLIGKWQFLTYCFIPFSVGMFPHLFQHWLTAKKASNFKLTVVAHPICIMITWIPCILLGMWAAGKLPLETTAPNAVLGVMVGRYSTDVVAGLISAGVLAAIMSSMDSQFLCLSGLFTNDIVRRYFGGDRFTDRQVVLLGRGFVVFMVAACYAIGLSFVQEHSVFDLGVWCFTGFASLFPVLLAALYWKRSNKYGAIAAVLTVAALWVWFLPGVIDKDPKEEFLLLEIGIMPVTVTFAASTLVLVVVTLITPRPDPEIVSKFFPEKS
ncbi:MAG: sodium:solute symporter family protein [Planctomycetota bacterium]|nr:sodium:solute symporter family protein [Planctomycetota bacterium]